MGLNPTIDPGKKARGSNQEPLRPEETEKMQKPPQIIVIPQSMLAGQKSLLRLAPSPMPRNTSPLLSTTSPSPLLQPSPCCSSGGEQETSSIPVTQRFPPGHQGGKKRKMPMKRQQGRGPT